jgi:hypothetical protein
MYFENSCFAGLIPKYMENHTKKALSTAELRKGIRRPNISKAFGHETIQGAIVAQLETHQTRSVANGVGQGAPTPLVSPIGPNFGWRFDGGNLRRLHVGSPDILLQTDI